MAAVPRCCVWPRGRRWLLQGNAECYKPICEPALLLFYKVQGSAKGKLLYTDLWLVNGAIKVDGKYHFSEEALLDWAGTAEFLCNAMQLVKKWFQSMAQQRLPAALIFVRIVQYCLQFVGNHGYVLKTGSTFQHRRLFYNNMYETGQCTWLNSLLQRA